MKKELADSGNWNISARGGYSAARAYDTSCLKATSEPPSDFRSRCLLNRCSWWACARGRICCDDVAPFCYARRPDLQSQFLGDDALKTAACLARRSASG